MKLLEDIIAEAIDEKASLAGMLRKCLVLAEALNAEELKVWANQELDGYDNPEMLPDYRKFHTIAKGNFTGPLGASIRNQPLPSAVLEPRHRHFCEQAQLVQPIAAYRLDAKGNDGSIDWPPNLTVKYQSSFYQGYALANAWQVIPHSAMAGMLDTIRTRILRFALEIKKQIGLVDENVQNIPQEKVNQTVTNIIYGGQNVIGSTTRDIQQMGDVNISKGDLPALRDYLARVGVSQEETEKLEEALIADAQEAGAPPQVGERVRAWLGKLSDKGLKIGGEVGAGLITAVICKYLGVV